MKVGLHEFTRFPMLNSLISRRKRRSFNHQKGYLYLSLILLFTTIGNFSSKAQVVINEILPPGRVELINIGTTTIDISNYWLCNFPSYQSISTLTIQCGNTLMTPGEILTVSNFPNFTEADGEMGLYSTSSFSSAAAIVDYVEWGSSGHQRSSVAQAAGIWTAGDFVPAFNPGMSIEYDANGSSSANWDATLTPTICTQNSNVPLICDINSGMISTTDDTSICVDGIPDPIDVMVTGNPTGSLGAWIITDDNNNILALPNTPPFDLDGAGVGTCIIWYVRFDTGFAGNVIGNNLSDLVGCFEISNGITVTREGPDGGVVTLLDGSTEYIGCAGDIVFDVMHTTASASLSYWYIITDDNDNILAFQNSSTSNTLDLSAAPAGTCRVYGWSNNGSAAPIAGNPITSLSVGDCEAVSADFITVYREIPDGGTITFADGSTTYTGVAGNIFVDVVHTTTANNLPFFYIITDASDNILNFQNSSAGGTLDISSAPPGTCKIYGWSASGTSIPGAGDPITILEDEFCEDLSDGFVTVIRTPVEGGTISTTDNTNICVDGNPDPINVMVTGASGTNSGWIITDDNNNILALPPAPPFDLDGAGVGTCFIWYVSYEDGFMGNIVGNNLADLAGNFGLSNGIMVTRETPDGGVITLADGNTTYSGVAGNIMVDVIHTTTAINLPFFYIITDDNDNILAFENATAGGNLDLSGAPAGTCRIYGWSALGTTSPVAGDPISSLEDESCEALSNGFITVIRNSVDGGTISTMDNTNICVDGNPDPINVAVVDATGTNNGWIITDDNNNILALPPASPFDLDGAGVGTCIIWYVSYEDGFAGNVVGNNISDFTGNFDLSNGITVTRETPDGGAVTLLDGSTNYVACAGDILFDVTHTTTAANLSYWYIITDDNDNILASQNSTDGSTLNLSGAPAGTCRIYGWSNSGEPLPIPGDPITSLSDGDCETVSADFITVYREIADGGVVTLADGSTTYTGVAGNIMVNVIHTTTATNLPFFYIVTDDSDNILAFANSTAGGMLDLSGAPAGTCRIYGWSATGTTAPVVGDPISSLVDEFCESVSNAFITVIRNPVDGGTISTTDNTNICVDGNPDPINVAVVDATGTNNGWIITDDNNNILALPPASPFDLDGAGVGTCIIWYVSYEDGFAGNVVGNNISDFTGNFDLSNGITVTRETPDGGSVSLLDGTTSYAACAGDIVIEVTHNTSAVNLPYYYIITDLNNNILGFENSSLVSTLDLSVAPAGICRVWGWSASGEPMPVVGDPITTLIDGDCEAISAEFITVNREVVDGGTVMLLDGSTSYAACAGEIMFNVSHTTTAANLSYWYIITGDDDNILGFENATAGGSLDLSIAPAGVCRIYGWNASGEPMPVVGDPISTLSDGTCETVSADFITVYREVADGGTLDSDLGTDIEICIDGEDDPITVSHITTAPNLSYVYIITDDTDNILAWSTDPVINLEAAGLGTCRIWGWNNAGQADPVVGDPITSLSDANCEDISDNFITVLRVEEGVNCVVSTSNLSSVDMLRIYPNPTSDFVKVEYEGLENAKGKLVLIDLLGRTFLEKDLNQANDKVELDVSEIPFGVYLIRIDSENYSTIDRVVIMK